MGLSSTDFIMLKYVSPILNCSRSFIIRVFILPNVFSASDERGTWSVLFILLTLWSTLVLCSNWTILAFQRHTASNHDQWFFQSAVEFCLASIGLGIFALSGTLACSIFGLLVSVLSVFPTMLSFSGFAMRVMPALAKKCLSIAPTEDGAKQGV